jgi:hypothetical protein
MRVDQPQKKLHFKDTPTTDTIRTSLNSHSVFRGGCVPRAGLIYYCEIQMSRVFLIWFTGMTMKECSSEEISMLKFMKRQLETNFYDHCETRCWAPPLLTKNRS